jgi:hypothetical protein
MSLKTHYLLHRSGRNQFGDPGDGPMPRYVPSPQSVARDEKLIALHHSLNDQFANTHRAAWLALVAVASKKDAWLRLHPRGRPSLSWFYAQARACGSFEDFLVWWLVSRKAEALRMLGFTPEAIADQLKPFKDCGRYQVCFGSNRERFGT